MTIDDQPRKDAESELEEIRNALPDGFNRPGVPVVVLVRELVVAYIDARNRRDELLML